MVRVKVKFYGVIKDVTDGPSAEVEVRDDATIFDLVHVLHLKYGQDFYDRVMDDVLGVQSCVRFFLNDEEVDEEKLATTKVVVDGAPAEVTLYVMSAMMGGTGQRQQQDQWFSRG